MQQRLHVRRRVPDEDVAQHGFEAPVNLAEAPRLWRIREAVQSFVLLGIQPAAHGIAVYAEDVGELFESEAFSGQQNRMSALPLAVRFGLVMHGFQGDLIGFGERRNELHFSILPEGKIPDYLCTITYNLLQKSWL